MKNIKTLLFFFITLSLVSSCNTIRKGFTPDRKSGEEFLVEKKSPLVIPPNFNELPIPKQLNKKKEDRKLNVKSILLGSENKELDTSNSNKETISTIEKLILKKIKKN